ncbi:hypothetical protein V6N13_149717 [Hibiscus sabdariffa]
MLLRIPAVALITFNDFTLWVAAPRHVMAGEVGFHDVVPAVMDRMAEDIGLDLQARGQDGCDHIMAVRQQVDNGVAGITKCLVQDQADTGHVGSPASDRSNGTCAWPHDMMR